MSGLFFELGRRLGHAAIPTVRKARWAWKSLTGSETDVLRAETELGRMMAAETRRRLPPAADPRDAELLRRVCRRLSEHVRDPARTFTAEAVHTGCPTAIALPGGFIFVDTSLLALGERCPDELAFVVGHEMAHVIRGHAFKRLATQAGFGAATALLSRATFTGWLSQSGLRLLHQAYSRDAELEADEWGARLAGTAGYDAAAAFRWLERLAGLRAGRTEGGDYLGSHPPASERIARLRANLGRRPSQGR